MPVDNTVVPTSDPAEELLVDVPASNPYEEVVINGYSQRDNTREAVEALMDAELRHAEAKLNRRLQLEAKLARRNEEDRNLDLDLLSLKYGELEAEHDNLQEKYDSLCEEHARLQEEHTKLAADFHPYKISLPYFQRETGRWRWAAANGYTRITAAMREFMAGGGLPEFTAAVDVALEVLRHPN
ncbi:hypothetical protein B0H17DRAFT_1130930 [Mycena rosella]|uniref:Uncharacterized protein n=1 Tax=Mycena rosella TaxID=1033263 RepID=A0AAD7DQ37_MYCRO|nr:hypothetical protein B0H17DRAFT_1130930 [Mycena rosella]